MFPNNIVITSVLYGECEVNVDRIISHWHSGAEIVKKDDKYTLVEHILGDIDGNVKMKVRISSEDAHSIIKALKLSARESSEHNTTLYK